MTYEVDRSPERSTYTFRLEDLDYLRDRVSDLYAVGATGKEKVKTADSYRLQIEVASNDLWPRDRRRRVHLNKSKVLIAVQWVIIVILFMIII